MIPQPSQMEQTLKMMTMIHIYAHGYAPTNTAHPHNCPRWQHEKQAQLNTSYVSKIFFSYSTDGCPGVYITTIVPSYALQQQRHKGLYSRVFSI